MTETLTCASAVDAPMCGVAITRGCFARAQSSGGSLSIHVDARAPHDAAVQGGDEVLLHDDAAARAVHEEDALLHLREGLAR